MTAKGNIRNLETTFMWTVKSSNHLHSRILDFSSSSLILLVVSETSLPWCFSIFSAFFFCHVELFHAVIISKAYRKIFLFLDLKPLPVFFSLFSSEGFIDSLQQLNVIQTFCTLNSLAFGLFISEVTALRACRHLLTLPACSSYLLLSSHCKRSCWA